MTVLGNSMANLKGFLPVTHVTRGFPADFGSQLQRPHGLRKRWAFGFRPGLGGDKCGIGIVWNPMEPQELWIEPLKPWANLPTNSSKYRIQPTTTMGSTKLAVTSITWGLKQLKETSSPLSMCFLKEHGLTNDYSTPQNHQMEQPTWGILPIFDTQSLKNIATP